MRGARKGVGRRRLPGRARRAARRALEEATVGGPSNTGSDHEPLGPLYAAGPALSLADNRQNGIGQRSDDPARPTASGAHDADTEPEYESVATRRGSSQKQAQTAQANSLTLQGRTDATFNSSFRTVGVRQQSATDCVGCDAADCVRATGVIVATYRVQTQVTLPSVRDFPDLTPCQRRRVQNAIRTVLAPHEQEHVTAFRTYNGATRTPFDLTVCRSDLGSAIDGLFQAEEQARQAAAQAASDALDPFHFDVDLDCEDHPHRQNAPGPGVRAAAPADEDEP